MFPESSRLAFLDMLLDLVDKGEMEIGDVRPEVDTFMMEVSACPLW
jgi:hypothetical protein